MSDVDEDNGGSDMDDHGSGGADEIDSDIADEVDVDGSDIADEEDDDEVRVNLDAGLRMVQMVARNIMQDLGESEEDEESDDEIGEPVMYDVHEPALHSYLFDSDDHPGDVTNSSWLEPNKKETVPILELNVVVLPGQMIPLHTGSPSFRRAIMQAVTNKSYVALRTRFSHESAGNVGILLQITKYSDDGMSVKANTVGRQRCQFLPMDQPFMNGVPFAEVTVLDEYLLPTYIEALCPSSYLKYPKNKKMELCGAMSCIPSFVGECISTERNCEKLSEWMKMWYSDEKIKCSLGLGPIQFSYWVASHLPVSIATKYEFLEENNTDLRLVQLLRKVDSLTSLVCQSCSTLIANMNTVVNMSSEGTSNLFVNSAGYVHEMVTVSHAQNFVRRYGRSSKCSWFAGYKWQIIECTTCAEHLGWEFTSSKFLPASFFGISRRSVRPIETLD